jgi:hypothetical protein
MRIILLSPFIFLFGHVYAQSYKEIHREVIVVDTHNDIFKSIGRKRIQSKRYNENSRRQFSKSVKGK